MNWIDPKYFVVGNLVELREDYKLELGSVVMLALSLVEEEEVEQQLELAVHNYFVGLAVVACVFVRFVFVADIIVLFYFYCKNLKTQSVAGLPSFKISMRFIIGTEQ